MDTVYSGYRIFQLDGFIFWNSVNLKYKSLQIWYRLCKLVSPFATNSIFMFTKQSQIFCLFILYFNYIFGFFFYLFFMNRFQWVETFNNILYE